MVAPTPDGGSFSAGTIQVISAAVVTVITVVGGIFSLRYGKRIDAFHRDETTRNQDDKRADEAEIRARQGLFSEQRALIAIMQDERRDMLERIEDITKLFEKKELEKIEMNERINILDRDLAICKERDRVTQLELVRCQNDMIELRKKCQDLKIEVELLNRK